MQDPDTIRETFEKISPRYDLANRILSLGIDTLWRKRVIDLIKAQRPKRILDLACGTGDLALALQKHCPEAEVTGADFTKGMLDIAVKRGLKHALVADALNLPFEEDSFDVLCVSFGLRNMADYNQALEQMHRVLRPGGLLIVLDFSLPPAPLRAAYRWYLHHVLPKVAAMLTGHKDAYTYLGESIEQFPQGEEMRHMITASGFHDTGSWMQSFGIATLYSARA